MILPVSKIWIDYFNGRTTSQTELLDDILANGQVIVGDIILNEVLQGFRTDTDFDRVKHLLTCLPFREMLGQEMALQSAQNYRLLRQKGLSIRNTTNLIVGTFCVVNKLTVLHDEPDFSLMVEHLGLPVL
ncbi:MAG TPA: VapC toxin family PIN domain ribonuclease [Gammaproteobacteria bacterium]|nr:PIN domain nuclease [Candidatus Parabeggiatoa sp.]HAI68693.1 VapC toxin family PIN domain ribonuclease [Gammaproteobacteria bacterium]HIE01581.1 PIN domain nuclease [Thiotrichaceae bacterium]